MWFPWFNKVTLHSGKKKRIIYIFGILPTHHGGSSQKWQCCRGYLLSKNLPEPHTRAGLGLDVAGHGLLDSPCWNKIQEQLYLQPTQFWPLWCVMFTFLNPVTTAGHEPSYLQDSAPLYAAHPNPVLRHWPGADWKGSCWILVLASCILLSYSHSNSVVLQKCLTSLIWWDCHIKWSRWLVQNGTRSKNKITSQHL